MVKYVICIHTAKKKKFVVLKKSLVKLRLCRAASPRNDDVTARGGADLPRRCLCSAFNTVAPKARGKL